MESNKVNENQNIELERGWWHGNDAWILDNDGDFVTFLIGGNSEEEARMVQKLVMDDRDLGTYGDFVECVDIDEWKEQQEEDEWEE